jgi:hypothetical protein
MTTSVKTCFKCGAEKPLTDFYKHPQMKDGRVNKCKACNKVDVRVNRRKKLEYYREYDSRRGVHGPSVTNRAKKKTRWATMNAVRDGRLNKPDHCQVCGCAPSRIEAHHHDYKRPDYVTWVCTPCHHKFHSPFIFWKE